jgi:biofilm protein TabA
MIFGHIDTDYNSLGLPAAIVKALDWLKATDLTSLKPGRYAIDGDAMYASVETVTTKKFATTRPESHKNYLDVQYVVDGTEQLGFAVDRGQADVTEAMPERDLYFYAGDVVDDGTIVSKAGNFAVFYPLDLHRPCCAYHDEPTTVHKVVVKIHKDLLK